jgi:hypothetical protein
MLLVCLIQFFNKIFHSLFKRKKALMGIMGKVRECLCAAQNQLAGNSYPTYSKSDSPGLNHMQVKWDYSEEAMGWKLHEYCYGSISVDVI